MDTAVALRGTIVSGLGEGAYFMALAWVRDAVQELLGFEPYPGTLNVRLADGETRDAWREIRALGAQRLAPPPPESCGGWIVPVMMAPDVRAAVIVPDVTRHPDNVLEVIADVHVRTRLGVGDDDQVILLAIPGHSSRDS